MEYVKILFSVYMGAAIALTFLSLSNDVFQLELGGYFMWFFIAGFLMGCVAGIMLMCLMFASGKRK